MQAEFDRLVTHIWLRYIEAYMQGNLALTPDKILLRRTPTMPDAPATKGKARSLLALAPNQPSLPASCKLNGGLKLAFMPSCGWATANTCPTNLRASGSSRSRSSSLVTFHPSAIAERWGCEVWGKRLDVNGRTTRQTHCDCRDASRPWHASHVATGWVAYLQELSTVATS